MNFVLIVLSSVLTNFISVERERETEMRRWRDTQEKTRCGWSDREGEKDKFVRGAGRHTGGEMEEGICVHTISVCKRASMNN